MTVVVFFVSHLLIALLSFSADFLGIDLLFGVGIKGHLFALLDLFFICVLYFGFNFLLFSFFFLL